MSNKKRMRTVTGQVATRRVRPIMPVEFVTGPNREQRVGVFVVATLEPGGALQLAYVGAQLMVDTRGNHVLPHSQFVHEDKNRIMIYFLDIAVGELQPVAESIIRQLDERMNDHVKWFVPAGIMRANVMASTPLAGDTLQVVGRCHRPIERKAKAIITDNLP